MRVALLLVLAGCSKRAAPPPAPTTITASTGAPEAFGSGGPAQARRGTLPLKPPMVTLAKSPLMPDAVSISTLSSWLASPMPLMLKATLLPIATLLADSAGLFAPATIDSAVLSPKVTVCATFKVAGVWIASVPPVTLTLPPRLLLPPELPSPNCNRPPETVVSPV